MTSIQAYEGTATELINRPDEDLIAVAGTRRLTVGEFLERVSALAAVLPPGDRLFNLCTDRLNFLLAFCALISAGRTNVIPHNVRGATLDSIQRDLGCSLPALYDGDVAGAANALDGREPRREPESCGAARPRIAAEHLCTLSFTSGSTGEAKPVGKSWQAITTSTRINAEAYLGRNANHHDMVATVPPQHMYGMETSVFLPLQATVCVHGSRPLFPADLLRSLEATEAPRVLVTTPLHARALLASEISYPPVQRILSATAPLDAELAGAMERRFHAEVTEIYGSTETGSLARRHPVHEDSWSLFPGFQASTRDDGSTLISAEHLVHTTELPDVLQWLARDRFRLVGRQSDMINIAGKRGSLQELNRLLLSIPGVKDGAIFQPGGGAGSDVRLAALVVAPTVARNALLAALRERVDELFLPRPLHLVEALPRDQTGKLPRNALLDLFDTLQRQ